MFTVVHALLDVLAEPRRRAILDLLREAEQPVGALVEALDLSQPNVSKHLRILRDAGLVAARADGRRRVYRVLPEPLAELDAWLEPYRRLWTKRLDDLEAHLDEMEDSMTDPTMATVLEDDGQVALRYVRHLSHPPEKVWRAITESEHLQHWLPCDIVGERAEGAAIQVPFWPEHVERYDIPTPVLDGEILVWDPPRTFEWMWSTDRLRFELAPDGDGTSLTFTTWLSGAGAGTTKQASGYHLCLDQLAELLDTGTTATPLVDLPQGDLEQEYETLLR